MEMFYLRSRFQPSSTRRQRSKRPSTLHPQAKDRIDQISRIVVQTQESGKRIIEILRCFSDQRDLEQMPVHDFMDSFAL
jgi:hypothetical protein